MIKKTAAILTLGCRVNQYESDACAEVFEKYGIELCGFDEECDYYFINTCSITAQSDSKSRQMISKALKHKMKNPSVTVIAVGCGIQATQGHIPVQADFLCGNTNKAAFLEDILLGRKEKCAIPSYDSMTDFSETPISHSKNTRAFLKIEDGCENFCSYCIVPYLRGPVRSRNEDAILEEALRLAKSGHREIVLTGIETSFYGQDRKEKNALGILAQKVAETPGIERIRFGSLRPTVITDEFLTKLKEIPQVMPHFHLSVQSASSAVLDAMNRNYSKEDLYGLVEKIYSYYPDAGISADVICGFPKETEKDFSDTVDFVRYSRLIHAHVFPYSQRPGTPAAKMKQLPLSLRKERAARLIEEAVGISRDRAKDFFGKRKKVLVEKTNGGLCCGYTENYYYTKFTPLSPKHPGEIVDVFFAPELEIQKNTVILIGREIPPEKNCE